MHIVFLLCVCVFVWELIQVWFGFFVFVFFLNKKNAPEVAKWIHINTIVNGFKKKNWFFVVVDC